MGRIPSITVWIGMLAPLALWVLVWAGMQPGEIRLLLNYESPELLFTRSRALFPLFGGFLALVSVSIYFYRRKPRGFSPFGPLGLLVVYGLIGGLATLSSPDIFMALYWGGLYLAVPVVLLALVWGSNGLRRAFHLLTFNFVVIAILVTIFFVIALQQLNLGGQLLSADTWSNCRLITPWFGLSWGPFGFLPLSDGLLRPTGVGRFSAIAGIISLGALLGSRWRISSYGNTFNRTFYGLVSRIVPWSGLLGMAFLLLWTSGARTAILGFLASAIVVVLLYGGRRAIIGGAVVGVLVVVAVVLSGTPQSLVRKCIVYSAYMPGTSLLRPPTSQQPVFVPDVPPIVSEDQALPEENPLPSPMPGLREQTHSTTVLDTAESPTPTPTLEQEQKLPDSTTPSHAYQSPTPMLEPEQKLPDSTTPSHAYQSPTPPLEPELPTNTPQAAPTATISAPTLEQPVATPSDQVTSPPPTPRQDIPATPPLATTASPTRTPEGGTVEPSNEAEAALATVDTSAEDGTSSEIPPTTAVTIEEGGITEGFFAFSGRSVVWSAGWEQVLESPILGYGFHSDRLLLGTHMHNSYLHALLQAGFLGVIPFLTALLLAWFLLIKAIRNLDLLPGIHKHLVIQSAGVLVFFSMRSIPESTMAFFGIDYLLLAPFLLYLQFINSADLSRGSSDLESPKIHTEDNNVATNSA